MNQNHKIPRFNKGDSVLIQPSNMRGEVFDLEWKSGGWLYYCHTEIGVLQRREWVLEHEKDE